MRLRQEDGGDLGRLSICMEQSLEFRGLSVIIILICASASVQKAKIFLFQFCVSPNQNTSSSTSTAASEIIILFGSLGAQGETTRFSSVHPTLNHTKIIFIFKLLSAEGSELLSLTCRFPGPSPELPRPARGRRLSHPGSHTPSEPQRR